MEKKFKFGPLKKRGKKEKASGEKTSIKLARFIIEKQNWIVSVFVAACLLSAVAMLFVEVNYDLTEYLPDNARVNVLSLISVFVVVMFSFQSVLVPIIVMIPIEAAIYINMAVPYLVGETLVYMGYIIVSSIQLGATVDYSILLTNNYMTCRKTMKKKEAVVEALAMSCSSVFTSGTILILAGYIVYMISSTAAIGGLGHLIGRGALFSVCLVLTILPALLVLCDGIITSNEMDRFKKYLKRRHEKRKALVKSGIGAVKKKASAALARRGSQTAEVDGNEI